MQVRIITVGKQHDTHLAPLVADYQKRLQSYMDIQWQIISSVSASNPNEQKRKESEKILALLSPKEYVVLLDETGMLLTNDQFAKRLEHTRESAQTMVFIIGGAYGVDQALKRRASMIWSFSPLVFPHQLIRLLLMEQLYRSLSIIKGTPYHHA